MFQIILCYFFNCKLIHQCEYLLQIFFLQIRRKRQLLEIAFSFPFNISVIVFEKKRVKVEIKSLKETTGV